MWKVLKVAAAGLAMLFWFAAGILWQYYATYGSSEYNVQKGRIYLLYTHGTVVYLRWNEHYALYGLMATGFFFVLLLAIIHISGKAEDQDAQAGRSNNQSGVRQHPSFRNDKK
jgi:hypothetical protein